MTLQPDILDEMTRDELIHWIRERVFQRPCRSDMLFVRWNIQSAKLMADRDAEMARWKASKPDFKVRDQLASQFNASTCDDERWDLIQQIDKYDQQLRDHIAINRAHDRRQKRIDRLYEQIDIEQRKEQQQKGRRHGS